MKKYLLIFFLLVTNACFSQVHLSQGLVAYYPFNGNANDASGNGNNPIFNNAALTADRSGNANNAYSFNGVDNYIQIPNSPSLNPSSAISLCAWVKVKGLYTGPCRGNSVLMKGITEGSPSYKIRLDENHYPGNYSCGPTVDLAHEYFYGQGLGANQAYSYEWTNIDQWYSVVYTYDGKTAKLYIDCVLKMSLEVPGLSMTNNEDLFIGRTNLPFYPYWFNGVIDEVRIYDRAINPTEVMAYGGCCTTVNSETHNPAAVCAPGTIDITTPAITAGSDNKFTYSYFTDPDVTIPVGNPAAINASGVYYIKGTAKDICTSVEPVTVTIWERPSAPAVIPIQPTCTVATGSINVTAPDPINTFYYSIDQTSYTNTSGTFTPLVPKSYDVTIKNSNGCVSAITSVIINAQPITPPAPVVTTVNNCDGTSILSAAATGTLLWSNNETSSSVIVNTAGTYTVTQTANGCTSLPASTIATPKFQPATPVVTVTNNCDGTSTLSTPATGSLLWSNNATTPSVTVNTAGNYSVVQTVNGCTSLAGLGTAEPKQVLSVTGAAPDIACGQTTGVITINASNGTSPYSYSIDAGTSYQNSNLFTDLAAGIYTVKVKDAAGCTSDIPVTIKQLNSTITATVSAPAIACGQTTGTITVTAQNGASPYSYSMDAGATYQSSNIFLNVAAGSYVVKVKDAGGCTLDVTATLQQLNSTITATTNITDINCTQATGSFSINAANGKAPYSYSIDAGAAYQSSNIFPNLAAGNYTARIKDAGGCILDIPVTIKKTGSTITAALKATEVTCIQTSGTITVSASNGASPYGYSINGGTTYQSSNTFNNLLATNYMIRIKDALGCFIDAAATIKQNNSIPDIKITNPSRICEPGTVDLTAPSIISGSETGLVYTYFKDATLTAAIDNPNTVKTSGTYYIKGLKANGCYTAKAVTVLIPPKSIFAVSSGGSVCNNDPVQLKASGGTSYLWQPTNIDIPNPVVKPAVTTTYTVKIKDSVCNDSSVLTTTIKVLSLPTIKASKSNDIDCSNDFCQLNVTGGTKYIWQPSAILNDPNIANPIARPVTPTKFTVTGYDDNGCKNSDTLTVNVDMNAINKSGYSMPTAFTPNNDGLNDCFGLKFWGAVTKLNFSVYNRFGERIFYSTDPNKACWDGRYKGVMQEVGAYVYFIQATTPCDVINRKGTVMILR